MSWNQELLSNNKQINKCCWGTDISERMARRGKRRSEWMSESGKDEEIPLEGNIIYQKMWVTSAIFGIFSSCSSLYLGNSFFSFSVLLLLLFMLVGICLVYIWFGGWTFCISFKWIFVVFRRLSTFCSIFMIYGAVFDGIFQGALLIILEVEFMILI